jgi:hypothetical protein
VEPMESVEHDLRGAIEPPLVHIHRLERVEQRSLGRSCSFYVPRKLFGLVELEAVGCCESVSDGRLAAAASASDEADVTQPVPQFLSRKIMSVHERHADERKAYEYVISNGVVTKSLMLV